MENKRGKKRKTDNKAEPLIQLSRRQATGWAAILLFISLWIFFLGVIVGRGMSPLHFDMDRIYAKLSSERKTEVDRPAEHHPMPDVEFHEKLKEAEPDEPLYLPPQTEKKQRKNQVAEKKTATVPNKTTSVKLKKHDGPVKTAGPAAPVAKAKGDLAIQVAAFKDAEGADQMVANLKAKGYPAYRAVSASSGKNKWHRVRIGPFEKQTEATAMLSKINREYKNALIIKH